MNAKETELNRIIDIVLECCTTTDDAQSQNLTREDILGVCKSDNAIMTRCILVTQILGAGFSVGTVAFILHRSPQSIRRLRRLAADFRATSRAYRIAEEEVMQRCA